MIIQIGSVINDDLAAFKQETIDIYSNISTGSSVPFFHDRSFFFSRVSDNKNSRRCAATRPYTRSWTKWFCSTNRITLWQIVSLSRFNEE